MLFGNRDFLNSIYGIYGSEYAEARGRLVGNTTYVCVRSRQRASWTLVGRQM